MIRSPCNTLLICPPHNMEADFPLERCTIGSMLIFSTRPTSSISTTFTARPHRCLGSSGRRRRKSAEYHCRGCMWACSSPLFAGTWRTFSSTRSTTPIMVTQKRGISSLAIRNKCLMSMSREITRIIARRTF